MEPRWAIYERLIAEMEGKDPNCKVYPDHKVMGRESKAERQIDIWVETYSGGLNKKTTTAIECRNYSPKNKIGIKDVDAFYGFLKDVGANQGLLVTTSGFTKGALSRAEGAVEIDTRVIPFEDIEDFEWEDFLFNDLCQNYNGCFGSVGWSYYESPDESVYGHCSLCGALHIRCGFCGYSEVYDEMGCGRCETIERCVNEECRGEFILHYHKGEIDDFEARLREDEDEEY